MKISKNSLQARINNISKEKGVHANILLKTFFFDCFISRLAKTKFADCFVFKGGFFLSKKLGIEHRSTVDVDFLVRHLNLEEQNIINIIEIICKTDVDDGVTLKFSRISKIREEDLYGGFNIIIEAQFENIRDIVSIDVATGDPITPKEIPFIYQTLITKEEIKFNSYNFETVLAEKLQTILSRGELNSRCKDFYDIFIIFQTKRDEISNSKLILAFEKTCQYRNTNFKKEEANAILDNILSSKAMKERWQRYSKKNAFAKGITFQDTTKAIKDALGLVFSSNN